MAKSQATCENQEKQNDQQGADDSDAVVTEPIAIASEAATKAAEQEDDEDDDQNESNGHELSPVETTTGRLMCF